MSNVLSVTLGSAVANAVSGTITGLDDRVIVGAGMTFAYGSGGTAGTAYLQTSPDSGVTWFDVAGFSFGTASVKCYATLGQPAFGTATFAATDGALGGGTVAAIPVGERARIKYSNIGTYAGTTTLNVFLDVKR